MSQTSLSRIPLWFALLIGITLGMTQTAFATYYFWTGAVSADAADPDNWDSDSPGTMPTGAEGDVALIGVDSSWQLVTYTRQPVLSSEWPNNNGDPNGGWWIINGVGNQNSLTIGDGAYLICTHNDGSLRNGATLRVTGKNPSGGPSIIIPPRFRIGQNGNNVSEYSNSTSTILIEDNGYLRFDPSVALGGSGGSRIYMGGEINALIDIRDEGILEIVDGSDTGGDIVTPQFIFASSNPEENKIVISGNGQLILSETQTSGIVEDVETSLEGLIAIGLIASGEEGFDLIIDETGPVTVKLQQRRVCDPSPLDEKPNADQELQLSWTHSLITDQYDLYFGTDFDEVNSATRENPLNVLQSMGQTENTYPADSTLSLEHGQTYYWRVDEVDTTPDQALLKGAVWSFTVEAYAIPVPTENITASSSSSRADDQGPGNTINGSGLDANDLHSSLSADMWLSDAEEPNSAWIQFDFDKPFKLQEMLVWNYNGILFLTGAGLQEVTIEYSSDGMEMQSLGAFTFAQAPGSSDYSANTTIPLDGITVKTLKITAQSNWTNNTMLNIYGLSEVRFLHIPVGAREPNPESGATEVAHDTTLTWRAGRKAAEHDLYLGTDEQAVTQGTTPLATVSDAEYSPVLNLGTTYYWRVDEVNHADTPSVWTGSTWSFTTAQEIVVDDFESYTNSSPNHPFQTWLDGIGYAADDYFPDGYEGNGTGAMIGHDIWGGDANYVMELEIVYGGEKSLPLYYEGDSQTDLLFSSAQDWTQSGINSLVIHFYGTAGSTGQLYAKIGNTEISYSGNIASEEWITWEIDLGSSGASLSHVSSLSIGIDGNSAEGLLYIDDILLK